MLDPFLSRIFTNEWLVIAIVSAVLLIAPELGFRFGLRLHRAKDEARRSQIGGVQGAVLALLGLLLGFTFAMAVGRRDARGGMVLEEANAIGTTWLRAGLLPGDHPKPVKELLRRYVDVRIAAREVSDDPAKLAEGLRASAEIQKALWTDAESAAKESPTTIVAAYINALNATIDADAKRVAAGRNHIPPTVWLLVLFVGACGCFTSVYGSGAQSTRSNFTGLLLPLLIVVVIGLIFDLDHSLQGMIGVSQRPMLDLKATITE